MVVRGRARVLRLKQRVIRSGGCRMMLSDARTILARHEPRGFIALECSVCGVRFPCAEVKRARHVVGNEDRQRALGGGVPGNGGGP